MHEEINTLRNKKFFVQICHAKYWHFFQENVIIWAMNRVVLYLPLYLLWIPILLSCGKNVKTICVYRSNVHPSDHAQRQQAEYLIWLMYFKWLDAFLKDKHVCLWKNLRVGITITWLNKIWWWGLFVFSATFNNVSAILLRSVFIGGENWSNRRKQLSMLENIMNGKCNDRCIIMYRYV